MDGDISIFMIASQLTGVNNIVYLLSCLPAVGLWNTQIWYQLHSSYDPTMNPHWRRTSAASSLSWWVLAREEGSVTCHHWEPGPGWQWGWRLIKQLPRPPPPTRSQSQPVLSCPHNFLPQTGHSSIFQQALLPKLIASSALLALLPRGVDQSGVEPVWLSSN